MIPLTRENYHSREVNQQYLSVSQFNSFLDCEAAVITELAGKWEPEKPIHYLVGQFIHTWCEGNGAHDRFLEENKQAIFTKQGKMRAEFEQADLMVVTLIKDKFAMHTLQGEKEVIMTADLFGVPWKTRMDVYVPKKRIVDLKTTKSIRELQWSQGSKVTFIEQYNYWRQVAIYSEVERLNSGGGLLDFYMVAVSKEKVPDKEVINLTDHERVGLELAKIGAHMPRILAVKEGRVEPVRCGCCDYCRSTKKLTGAVYYTELSA
jgi:hypothetical protein